MTDPHACLEQISNHIASVKLSVATAQSDQQSAANALRDLAAEVTGAFVELARHYLPELSHQALENSWVEVRHQIRQCLLLRDDRSRQLRNQLAEAAACRRALQAELNDLRDQMDRGKRDLMSKMGNVKKVLRLAPCVRACNEEISRLDRAIEQGIRQFEIAEQDARKKLPSYEACSLFNYLKDRHYGTKRYNESGLERRWDRWVAKLIDYDRAKASFDYLRHTPEHLDHLISEKRDRYKALLVQLEEAQTDAIKKFGTDQQQHLLTKIDTRIETLLPRLQDARQRESQIQSELLEVDSLEGEHYQQAIKVYETFLSKQDPEILSVYAACTQSPIDDEICARLRNIHQAIDQTQMQSVQRTEAIKRQESIIALLYEVSQLMRAYLRVAESDLEMADGWCFDDWVNDLTNDKQSPSQAWRSIRSVIRRRDTTTEDLPAVLPLDAVFLAASGSQPDNDSGKHPLLDNVSLQTQQSGPNDKASEYQYSLLAKCNNQADAAFLTWLLDPTGIPCFVSDDSQLGAHQNHDLLHLMVGSHRFDDAKQFIEDQIQADDSTWMCRACQAMAHQDDARCWHCGHARD
jgi:hypothetical protein